MNQMKSSSSHDKEHGEEDRSNVQESVTPSRKHPHVCRPANEWLAGKFVGGKEVMVYEG